MKESLTTEFQTLEKEILRDAVGLGVLVTFVSMAVMRGAVLGG